MTATTRAPASRSFTRHAAWYLAAGAASTAMQAALFMVLRAIVSAYTANLAAIAVTTLANTEFHRRVTFLGSPDHARRRYLQTAATIAFYAASGSLALLALHALVDDASPLLETATLVVISCAGGIARFYALRNWVFRTKPPRALALHARVLARHAHVLARRVTAFVAADRERRSKPPTRT